MPRKPSSEQCDSKLPAMNKIDFQGGGSKKTTPLVQQHMESLPRVLSGDNTVKGDEDMANIVKEIKNTKFEEDALMSPSPTGYVAEELGSMEIEVCDAASAQTLGRTITKVLEGLDKGGENTAAAWGGGSLTGKMDTNHVAPRKLNQSESSRLRSLLKSKLNLQGGGEARVTATTIRGRPRRTPLTSSTTPLP